MIRPAVLAACVALAGACTLDTFLYHPVRVDGYDFDGIDPNIDGDLTEPHPSIVGPELRTEGFVDAEGDAIHYVYAKRPGARATIFYSHGNSLHIGRYWDRVERMWSMGYNVLIYDYPGYGRSEGEPSEHSVFASARAALAELPNLPGVDPERVYFVGYSLGGAPTFELATDPQSPVRPRGVLTESAFCNVETLLQDATFLDVPAEFVAENRLDNCAKIGRVPDGIDVVLLHGDHDTFVRPIHARRLYDAARPPTRLVWAEGADHTDVPLALGDDYDALFRRHLPP